MSWQDVVFLTGNLVFVVALIPVMRMKHSGTPLRTALMNTAMLAVYTYAFATLGLWLSAAGSALVSLAWAVVAYRRWWSLWWRWDTWLIGAAHCWLMDREDRRRMRRERS